MAASEKLTSLVNQMPDPDKRGTYGKIDKQKVESAIAAIHKGGRENVLGLIDMLVEPGKGNDIKPHYALHVLAVHVCKQPTDKPRAELAKAIVSKLPSKPKGVQRYLIRQLQIAGGAEVVPALGKALTDPALCEPAAQALVAIRAGAADQLCAALPNVSGRCRLIVLLGLAVLADRKGLDLLRKALNDGDSDARLIAARGLANLADASSARRMLRVSDQAKGWERVKTTNACLLLAENLLAAGDKATAAVIGEHLRGGRTAARDAHVRRAAEKVLVAAAQ